MDDILISPHNLISLIEQVSSAPSVISPISALRAMAASTQTPPRNDVTLSTTTMPLIQTLAEPLCMGTMVYAGQRIYMDISVYVASGKDSPVVALSSQQERLRLQSPPPIEATSLVLSEQTGNTLLDTLDISWRVSKTEALLLMATLDAARRQEFERFLDESEDEQDAQIPISKIAEVFEMPLKSAQWLAPYFRASLALDAPDGRVFQSALLGLEEKGIIHLLPQAVTLSAALSRALAGLMLVEGHLLLRSAILEENKKTLSGIEIRVIQGRTGAFLAWMSSGSDVQFFSASAAGVINLAEKMLGTPWQALNMDTPTFPPKSSRDGKRVGAQPQPPPKSPERLQRKTS